MTIQSIKKKRKQAFTSAKGCNAKLHDYVVFV